MVIHRSESGQFMNRLDAARMHLSSALDSLSNRMAQAATVRSAALEPMRDIAEAEAVRAERDRLLDRLTQLEEESRALMNASDDVDARLDGAIAEIREVLLEMVA
jgi:Domain of unknown function (DUF4164)